MTPETEIVKVNLEREVLRMAEADGVTNPAQLKLKLVVIRREYYETVIRSYYRGVDKGFADGAAAIGKPFQRDLRAAFLTGVVLGAVVVAGCFFGFLHVSLHAPTATVEGR